MKILVLGDLHLKENLGYSDYVAEGRGKEKQDILDFIVNTAKDCDKVVMLGDQLDSRNNPSRVIKEFTGFIERFEGKDVYIIGGNHELAGDGTSAIDYLSEIRNPRWHIYTYEMGTHDGLYFLPFMNKRVLGTGDDHESAEKITAMLQPGDVLFSHYAFTGCSTASGQMTDLFSEPVLNLELVSPKFKKIYAGHIHKKQKVKNLTVAGSIFCNEVGETEKFIFIYDTETGIETEVALPGRSIYKIENPTVEQLEALPVNSIVKAINTNRETDVEKLKVMLGDRFDAYLLSEKYDNQRQKVHFEEGAIDLSIESLLEIYAKSKKIDLEQLKKGFELIK